MRRLGPCLQVVLFGSFILGGSVFMWFQGGSTLISETENRALAPYPALTLQSLKSGQYFRQLENYTADHIAYRDSIVGLSKNLTSWYGLKREQAPIIVASGANNTGAVQGADPSEISLSMHGPAPSSNVTEEAGIPSPPPPSSKPDTEVAAMKQESQGHVLGKVLITGDKAMNLFSYRPAAGEAYAAVIQRFHASFEGTSPPQPMNISVLLAPTAIEFVESAQLRKLSDSQQSAINEVYGKLGPSIRTVDAWSSLSQHKDEPLYFRTDHHWTATGAYYAYDAFIHSLGLTPVELSQFPTETVSGFLGSLYSATLNKKLEKNPDTIQLYKPTVPHEYVVHYSGPLKMSLLDMNHANKKNKYRIFLSGDRPWGLIKTETPGGRKLAVIKDSYGNAFIPFLVQHFSEIYVIDPRQFTDSLPEFLVKNDVHDVLFLNNAEVLMDTGFADQLSKLIP
jgi:hypothetical protein